jgi:hypothetical protein
MKTTRDYLDTLTFFMMPVDGGQIVEVTYACDADGVWCRTFDRSDRSESYGFAKYNARATEAQLAFEPQNGKLPKHNSWKKVSVF